MNVIRTNNYNNYTCTHNHIAKNRNMVCALNAYAYIRIALARMYVHEHRMFVDAIVSTLV